jgi:hypothetical protein
MNNQERLRLAGSDEGQGLPAPPIVGIAVEADNLRIEFAGPVELPAFAGPEWSVWSASSASGWPSGTGAFRPISTSTQATPLTVLRLVGPVGVEFREVRGDARSALEAGVDVLVTYDPAVMDYAEASTELLTTPGPWDRAYLLLARYSAPLVGTARSSPRIGPRGARARRRPCRGTRVGRRDVR